MAQTPATLNAQTRLDAASREPSRATLTAFCVSVFLATVLLILTAQALAAKWQVFAHLP